MTTGLSFAAAPLVLGLSLDTFAVSLAAGTLPLSGRDRVRFAAFCVLAEGGMPLIGMAVGSVLAGSSLPIAQLAPVILFAAGVWIVREALESESEGEVATAVQRMHDGIVPALTAALAISVDELAVGLAAGTLKISVPILAAVIAVQALLATFVGLRLGSAVGARAGSRAALTAGAMLIAAGIALAVVDWR